MTIKPIKVFIDNSPLTSGHAVRGIGNYTRNLIEGIKRNNVIQLVDLADQPDIIHYPYFDVFYYSLPINKKHPTVVTIHDVIPLVFPQHYPPGLKGKIVHQLQKIALSNVDAVITDSECSKTDIINYLHYPSEKIFVTYLAAGQNFHQLSKNNPNDSWWKTIR
ncbi:MAG: glycosyltransferase, partial [Bacteroidota bacterium]|nr:glycosyltransferase [Bacteroidota bacterium]